MNSAASMSYAKRLGLAAVIGAGITFLILIFVAMLNGAFVEKNLLTVTPCYFSNEDTRIREGAAPAAQDDGLACDSVAPEQSGIGTFFRNFTRAGSDDNATKLEQLKREGMAR